MRRNNYLKLGSCLLSTLFIFFWGKSASLAEEAVHPGLYRRREGVVDLSTIRGPGFGYRIDEIERELEKPVFTQ